MKTLILILLMAFVSLTGWAQEKTKLTVSTAEGWYKEDISQLYFGMDPVTNFAAPVATIKIIEERPLFTVLVDMGQSYTIYKTFQNKVEGGENKNIIIFGVAHALGIMNDLGYRVVTHSMELVGAMTVHYYTFEKVKK